MSKSTKILLAYAAGQVTQIVIHAACLANNMYSYRQVPFCSAAGFIVFFALVCGIWIATAKSEKPAHEKTYLDWAKAPKSEDVDEVVRLFENKGRK